jgi:DNA-binding beta-propeller fold protein YncE
VGVDREDNIYVADWGNDRIQKFTAEGEFVAVCGAPGRGHGEIRRPAGVCVDDDGYIYVADWGNHRVQVYDPAGRIVQSVRGEATLSKWAEEFLDANPLDRAAREESDLEPDLDFLDEHDESAHVEKYFWAPSWVSIHDGRLYVVDSNRHRLQLYDLAAAP